jgi:hypothetical protein
VRNNDIGNFTHNEIINYTKAWISDAVIGLNLCPFAKSVYIKNQIEYHISSATNQNILLDDLILALHKLNQTDAEKIDTTLLIHPWVLQDFLDYNDFLDQADAALEEAGLAGVLQIASFHPHYQFAGTEADDVTNCTNRSPFPMLHLLREESLDKAIAAMPDAADIFNRNIETLEELGADGWLQLQTQMKNRI